MAGYDPKQKRAHSPAEEKAPVDDLLGPPPTPVDDPDTAPATTGPEVVEPATPLEVPSDTAAAASPVDAPITTPAAAPRPSVVPAPTPASGGPDPKLLALVAAGVAAVLVWRWRRR